MINETHFEVMVYSCYQDTFVKRVTTRAKADMASVPDYGTGFRQEQLEDTIKSRLKPIRYNELIGCVDIHIVGTQLRADYWFTDKARIFIGSSEKGVISWRGKLLEKHYNQSPLSSPEIFSDFRAALDIEAKRHTSLKRRFVDFEAFDRTGSLIDWRAALGLR